MNHFCEWPIATANEFRPTEGQPPKKKPLGPSLALASYSGDHHTTALKKDKTLKPLLVVPGPFPINKANNHIAIFGFVNDLKKMHAFACMFKFSSAVLCSVRRKRKLFYHHWAAHSFPPKINFPSDGSGSCFTTYNYRYTCLQQNSAHYKATLAPRKHKQWRCAELGTVLLRAGGQTEHCSCCDRRRLMRNNKTNERNDCCN